jgi:hypothetical protein
MIDSNIGLAMLALPSSLMEIEAMGTTRNLTGHVLTTTHGVTSAVCLVYRGDGVRLGPVVRHGGAICA